MIIKEVISDKYAEQLYALFERKKWRIEEIGKYSVYDRFCERLAELENDTQRDLILDLAENFLWVNSGMYEKYLIDAFDKLFHDEDWKPEKGKNIFICPLLPERDFEKKKSSTFMLYLCESILLRTYEEFQDGQIRICETPEVVKEQKYRDVMGALILIDDFIGSGQTALECLTYLKFLQEEGKKIYILTLVAQKEGVENIQKETGISVYAKAVREKGISDRYDKEEAEEKRKEMKKISRLLQAPKGMDLGFEKSESLVAMNKTPNNTFPVYWCEKKGHTHAPFPRKENVKTIRVEKKEGEENSERRD